MEPSPVRLDTMCDHLFMRYALIFVIILSACATRPATELPAQEMWTALTAQCGKAFEGRVIQGTEPSDATFAAERLVMHITQCDDREIRIPFHVGENRSRTWILTRSDHGVRLKHDHRHEDGSEDEITQYGGDTRRITDPLNLDFYADRWTADLIPAARTNIWTVAVDPGRSFTYGLRRDEQNRHFRVEFDLSRPIAPPPPVW